MKEQIVNKKNKKTLLVIGILCFVAIISIVGYTYSYLQITVTNDTAITGTAASLSLELNVTKVAPDINKPLVPQLDSAIASAVVGTQGNCVDDNENAVCQVYEIVVKNTSNTALQVTGKLELNAGSNPNLKWTLIDGYNDGMTTNPNLESDIKTHEDTIITDNETYDSQQEKIYYLVVWISETTFAQADTGSFTGVVTFMDSNDSNNGDYPLLNTMNVGDYVAYEGDSINGCLYNQDGITGSAQTEAVAGNSCKGENANQSIDTNGTYGYCENDDYRYTTYGWRIAYIENDNVYLISAGSPECIQGDFSEADWENYSDDNFEESDSNLKLMSITPQDHVSHIANLNNAAKKYCNSLYADGGNCSLDNTWAMGNDDFKKITYALSGTAYNLASYYGTPTFDSNVLQRYDFDLIDNGGSYWFAAQSGSGGGGVIWSSASRNIYFQTSNTVSGFRPIIKLSSSVYVTGGEGIMTSPYEIEI